MLQTCYTAAALEDGDLLQTLAEPVMTTAQSLGELGVRFFLNLLVCLLGTRPLFLLSEKP